MPHNAAMSVDYINVKVVGQNQQIADAFKLFTKKNANEIISYQMDDIGIFYLHLRREFIIQ